MILLKTIVYSNIIFHNVKHAIISFAFSPCVFPCHVPFPITLHDSHSL